MIVAKRAARECARLLRQKALLSQKASRDSISRGHRLSREIALNWRSSASNIANGSGPLTINGVTMPSSSNTTNFSSLVDLSDCYASVLTETGTMELGVSAAMVESSTAARRRAEKAAAEQRKADLELLEARRQQRKLNFLITQTELYAHLWLERWQITCGPENPEVVSSSAGQEDIQEAETRRILRRLEEIDDSVERRINDDWTDTASDISVALDSGQNDRDCAGASFSHTLKKSCSSIAVAAKAAASRLGINAEEEYDIERVKSEALMKVKTAVTIERNRVSQFNPIPINQNLNISASVNTDASTTSTLVEAPKLFKGQLKAYQIRDEMGLGKTIQTVAFLGCLAENYNIWGPFLIVTPASTMHNWTQEFAKFLPAFRLVPYWGSPTERKVLRRFWSSTRSSNDGESFDESGDITAGQAGTKDSELHVVITSYQVVLQDAKFINKTSWSYIVLDEAHAIKSTSSLRWKILLSFKCRNRLLLTGTPIQNTMQELWALLHFIMPTLFDSHDEFANWFSRDIESQASETARTGPFMLRRTKTEVEHEISTKTEIMLYCPLSHRQQILYERLRSKIRLEDLSSIMYSNTVTSDTFSSSSASTNPNTIDNPNSSSATAHLINLVMQLRKVCNHPDLWERRDLFQFMQFTMKCGHISNNNYSANHSQHITWRLPNLLYEEDALSAFSWRRRSLNRLYSKWPISFESEINRSNYVTKCFSFARLLGLSISGYVEMIRTGGLSFSEFESFSNYEWTKCAESMILRNDFGEQEETASTKVSSMLRLDPFFPMSSARTSSSFITVLPHLRGLLLYPLDCEPSIFQPHVPSVFIDSPGIRPYIPNFVSTATTHKVLITPLTPFINTFNFDTSHVQSIPQSPDVNLKLREINLALPLPRSLELVSRATRISDSGKLTALDNLLTELKLNGHRVLIYSQMTRMIDILEEFMLYRKHAYLRLDGSSRLSDRRDMVSQWQTNPRWFVFLLSTRAGGLGINLTAADTVIFYDSDWNPTVDQQAMDRAHRLGQTKPVTVYRLICKNTVEGRMLRRAEEKRAMQQMVIHSGQGELGNLLPNVASRSGATDHITSSDMVSLLLDDDELVKRLQVRKRLQPQRGRPSKSQAANRLLVSSTVKGTPSTVNLCGNTSSMDTELPVTGQPSGIVNSVESSVSVQKTIDIITVDSDLLERKRQAAWAEQSRGGRLKKIRPLEAIGPTTISASNDN
ncbi:unnamed protein product [Heterobilharzia americana]|nr:unnamed protein product [Heterobilharzia americana]